MQAIVPSSPLRNPAGHTQDTILDALRGRYGARRLLFRYELLSNANVKLADLTNVVSCKIEQNWLADIKRKATFKLRDTGEINYLQDRIKPYVRLLLPPYGTNDWVEWPQGVFLLSSPARHIDQAGLVVREVEGYDGLQVYADDLVSTRYTVTALAATLEDFEDTTYAIAWTSGGTAWTRSNTSAGVGTWALRSGAIGNSATSDVVFTLPAGAVTAAFWYRTSSEAGFDFLQYRFGAIGAFTDIGSGESGWQQKTLTVPTGATALTFRYSKDSADVENLDAVFIDQLSVTTATVKYTDVISTLLGSVPKSLAASSTTVPADKEWEPGTSKLKIINELLAAINYESLSFDEDGTAIVKPYVAPSARPEEYTYADNDDGLIVPEVDQELDLFSVANKWVLVVSNPDQALLIGTYINDDPGSPTSTASRQRTITDFRTEQDAADQSTLDQKAARLAFEASQVFEAIECETALMPIHSGNDVVRVTYGGLAVDDKYSEQSWVMELRAGARMRHHWRRVVSV